MKIKLLILFAVVAVGLYLFPESTELIYDNPTIMKFYNSGLDKIDVSQNSIDSVVDKMDEKLNSVENLLK